MDLRKTPLNQIHKELSAKMVPFAGWEMPVQYTGIIDEHRIVRKKVGLFDVSHMGEIFVAGERALEAVQLLTTNDASKMVDGQVQYTLLCYPDGGIVDDVTLYKFNEQRFLFCVNASNTERDFEWIKENVGDIANLKNASDSFAQLSIQGPLAQEVLQKSCNIDLSEIKYYHFMVGLISSAGTIISRTGYTGEDGFEIYIPPEEANRIWNKILDDGKSYGIKPIGLGARDTLRLEMGYPLYGNELSKDTTPLEAGLARFVAFNKNDFIGKKSLESQTKTGIKKKLIGFKMIETGIARHGSQIFNDKKPIGEVTSGTMSPSIGIPIGMGYVEAGFSETGREIGIGIRNRISKAVIVTKRFYNLQHKL
ncbi:MAG: glycine cleavage system aminomethyltransferase GcvT [Deltaproteobacteria bacterium]|nr:glycine cleavage system aminomethyltransferase GcvT [Deltaproteobacteria bacterium]